MIGYVRIADAVTASSCDEVAGPDDGIWHAEARTRLSVAPESGESWPDQDALRRDLREAMVAFVDQWLQKRCTQVYHIATFESVTVCGDGTSKTMPINGDAVAEVWRCDHSTP